MTAARPSKAWQPVTDATMRDTLHSLATQRFGAVSFGELRAKRTHNAVVRYRVPYVTKDGQTARWELVVKDFKSRAATEFNYRALEDLRRHGFDGGAPDLISVPEPYHHDPERFTVFMQDIAGSKVRGLLASTGDIEYLHLLARVLAKLHLCRLPLTLQRNLAGNLRRLDIQLQRSRGAYELLRESLARLIEASAAVAVDEGDSPPVTLHGDFHPGQVHLTGDRAWLLDTASLRTGSAAFDIGYFFCYLDCNEALVPNTDAAREAFIATYRAAGGAVTDRSIVFYEAYSLLLRLSRQLARREDKAATTRRLLELAGQRLDEVSNR